MEGAAPRSQQVDRQRLSVQRLGELDAQWDAVAHRNLPDLTEHERPVTPVRGLQKG